MIQESKTHVTGSDLPFHASIGKLRGSCSSMLKNFIFILHLNTRLMAKGWIWKCRFSILIRPGTNLMTMAALNMVESVYYSAYKTTMLTCHGLKSEYCQTFSIRFSGKTISHRLTSLLLMISCKSLISKNQKFYFLGATEGECFALHLLLQELTRGASS